MGPGISVLCVCYRSKLYTRPASQPKTKRKRENFFNMEGLFFVLFFLGEYNNDLLEEDDDSRKLLGKLEAINWHTHTHTHTQVEMEGDRQVKRKRKRRWERQLLFLVASGRSWETPKRRGAYLMRSSNPYRMHQWMRKQLTPKKKHTEKKIKREKKKVFSVKGFYTILLFYFFPPQDTSIRTHFQCVAVSSLMAPLKPKGKKGKEKRAAEDITPLNFHSSCVGGNLTL